MQGEKVPQNEGAPGIRYSLVLLCLLLCFCFCCSAVAESTSAEEESAMPKDEEEDSWLVSLKNMLLDEWEKFEYVKIDDDWFIAFRIPGNVYAIEEPLHEQYVMAFLIIGDEKALLLDTCTGIKNVRMVVDILTDLPVTVLNSHDHFDHIGGNAYFDEVWCYNLPSAIQHLTQGPTKTELNEILDTSQSPQNYLISLGRTIPETIPGKAPTGTVNDGQVIDLGGRKLEVIHTPGHQPSCIMLLDRENKLLFTGDMFYPGPMYCMFDDSSFPDYVKSIRKAADLAVSVGVDEVYCSHNLALVATENLCRFADYLEAIERDEITDYKSEEGIRSYAMDDLFSIELLEEGAEPISGYSVAADSPKY